MTRFSRCSPGSRGSVRAVPAYRHSARIRVGPRRSVRVRRGVAAHGYYEYEGAIDSARFTAVWNRLIERHDALRLVVDVDLRQQRIVPTVPTFELHRTRPAGALGR